MIHKYLFLFFSLILITNISCCSTDKDCKSGKPLCHEDSCVACKHTYHCENDEYCADNKCVEYEKDILGEYCNWNGVFDCSNSEMKDSFYCGKCDDTKTLWEGVCFDYECVSCLASYQNGIAADHIDSVNCVPITAGSPKGRIAGKQWSDGSTHSFMQDSYGIAFVFIGLLSFILLVANCIFLLFGRTK
ncbi:hypothetical protein M0812_06615 [Anaeramoeba flamelloides]|uniref:Uncharacterized protein n=1 Tax=Anaeramoeba flamelloides TaxID=1746091 RepID=A0AAV8AA65_9EUKA|nr:hypothetical protein M0812_06615 [Anaeramoeba flamelloides]